MRTGRVPLAALLLVLASPFLQVESTNDIYWEGEEYASNEFLEVKHDDPSVLDTLKRFKRQWNPFSFFSSPKEAEAETATDPIPDDNGSYGKDDSDNLDLGSGVPDLSGSEPREKTLRVTFLVMEPYVTAYSNRDSPEFLNISSSLAKAVDRLFESLPGTQRSSLVRIQSLVNDDFLCKVTLDIVTTRNEDTDTIKEILRNHIKNNGRLGDTSVKDGDFSAQLIDPGTTFDCDFSEFTCDENICLPMSVKCNGRQECRDGTDEYDCPAPDILEVPSTTEESSVDYDNNIDYKERTDNHNPDDRRPYETSTDYQNNYDATPETPYNYDQRPDNSYNQSLEDPYYTNPDNRYHTDAGNNSPNPYDQNTPDNSDPYGTNRGPDNRDPYGENAGNRDPYETNIDTDNRDPYGSNRGPDNRDPYGENAGNRDPYETNTGTDNRDPYGTNRGPDNRDPYGENAGNRDPYETNTGTDNRDPYGSNRGPDNRDPYDQNAGNQDPYGPRAGPDTRNPYEQNGNTGSRPDDRSSVAVTPATPTSSYDQTYWTRGDLGGYDRYPTDAPTGQETDVDATTSRIYNECPPTHLRCDETRCVELTRRCDGYNDCNDGGDEIDCNNSK